MPSLADVATINPKIRRVLEDPKISHRDAERWLYRDFGVATSESSVRRARKVLAENRPAPAQAAPKDMPTFMEYEGPNGRAALFLPREGVAEEDLLRQAGFDPDAWRISGAVNCRKWMRYDQEWLFYYKFDAEQGESEGSRQAHIEDLVKRIRKRSPHQPKFIGITPVDQTYVIVLSDWQIGKSEQGRGSADTVERWKDCLAQAREDIIRLRKSGVVIDNLAVISVGDLVEGCGDFYCVSSSTPVLTKDLRWVPAGSLEVGDELYAFEEEGSGPRGRKYAPSTVLSNKVEEMDAVKVTFNDGTSLVCTPEHPLLTSGSSGKQKKSVWTAASDLVPGHRVAKLCDPWRESLSKEAGWLAGIYDGEGHLSAGRERSGPNILGVSQLPGLVDDKIQHLLSDRGFNFTTQKNPSSVNVHTIRGGYPGILRLLGTVRPERLISKIGFPHMRSGWVEVVSVEEFGRKPMARLGTSSHTYFANGFASHNSMQTFLVDLDRRNQCRVVREMLTETLLTLVPMFNRTVVACVGGNHGENRRKGKAFTTFADNDDVATVEAVKEAFDLSEWKNFIEWHIPDEELSQVVWLSGVPVGLVHGHQFRGGINVMKKSETWWRDQDFGMEVVRDAQILVSGHFHFNVEANVTHNRTWMQGPTIDPGSKWYTDASGNSAIPGVLTFVATQDHPLGYDHKRILAPADTAQVS